MIRDLLRSATRVPQQEPVSLLDRRGRELDEQLRPGEPRDSEQRRRLPAPGAC